MGTMLVIIVLYIQFCVYLYVITGIVYCIIGIGATVTVFHFDLNSFI